MTKKPFCTKLIRPRQKRGLGKNPRIRRNFLEAIILSLGLEVIGFWVCLIFGVMILALLVESEHPNWAGLVLIVWVLFLVKIANFNGIEWVTEHPWYTALIVASYFAVMPVWMSAKWVLYVQKRKRQLLESEAAATFRTEKEKFIKEAIIKDSPETAEKKWAEEKDYPPQVAKHKGDFVVWGIYWPFSLLATLVDEPVRRFFNWCYYGLRNRLQSWSNKLSSID